MPLGLLVSSRRRYGLTGEAIREKLEMIDPADILAIKRAFETAGRDGGLAELRRRFPAVKYNRVDSALEGILAMPVEPPPRFAGHGEPHRDKFGNTRRVRKP